MTAVTKQLISLLPVFLISFTVKSVITVPKPDPTIVKVFFSTGLPDKGVKDSTVGPEIKEKLVLSVTVYPLTVTTTSVPEATGVVQVINEFVRDTMTQTSPPMVTLVPKALVKDHPKFKPGIEIKVPPFILPVVAVIVSIGGTFKAVKLVVSAYPNLSKWTSGNHRPATTLTSLFALTGREQSIFKVPAPSSVKVLIVSDEPR